MSILLKKTACCLLFMFAFVMGRSSPYIQLGFSSTSVIATSALLPDSTLQLTFHDEALTELFSHYVVTEYKREFPAAIVWGTDHQLYRVYIIRVTEGTEELLNGISALSSGDVDQVFLSQDGELLEYNPTDYWNCSVIADPCPKLWMDLINAKGAWDYTRGLPCIKIGIVDERFVNHTDLDAKVANLSSLSPNEIHTAGNPWWGSFNYAPHGTMVAGAAAAITNNASGLPSLGHDVGLRYYSGIYAPLNYNNILQAALDSCRVINCSWYSNFNSTGIAPSSYHQGIIDSVYNMGVTVVAAAGNNNSNTPTDYFFPASYNHVISVSTVGAQNVVGDSTKPANWFDAHQQYFFPPGHPNYSWNTQGIFQHNDSVDICAPGYWTNVLKYNNSVGADGGTSLSSPIVAAAAALLYSLNPNFTPRQVERFLKQGAADISGVSTNYLFAGKLGAGRLDAGASLALAKDSSCLPPPIKIICERTNCFPGYPCSGFYQPLNTNTFWNYDTIRFSVNNPLNKKVSWIFRNGSLTVEKFGNEVYFLFVNDLVISTQRDPNFPFEVFVRYEDSTDACCVSSFYKEVFISMTEVARSAQTLFNKSLVEDPENQLIKIYPSPAKNQITITRSMVDSKPPLIENYQIISVEGRVLQKGTLTGNTTTLNINTLTNGVYIFKTQQKAIKFIKE